MKRKHAGRLQEAKSGKEYQKLTRRKMSFLEFMRGSPLVREKLEIERDKSADRDVKI